MPKTTVSAAGGAMPAIGDQMIYLVVCSHKGALYLAERDIADSDHVTTVRQIAEGQFENLVQVIEINPVEHTSRDVTQDMVRDVADVWAQSGEALTEWQRGFIELHLIVSIANQFRRAA